MGVFIFGRLPEMIGEAYHRLGHFGSACFHFKGEDALPIV